MAQDVFDLDMVRAAHINDAPPIEYRTLKLYGREWRVRPMPNVAVLLAFADGGGASSQLKFLIGYIHSAERADFLAAIEADEHFDETMLEKLTDYLTKADTGRPTTASSGSAASSSATTPSSTVASSPGAQQDFPLSI